MTPRASWVEPFSFTDRQFADLERAAACLPDPARFVAEVERYVEGARVAMHQPRVPAGDLRRRMLAIAKHADALAELLDDGTALQLADLPEAFADAREALPELAAGARERAEELRNARRPVHTASLLVEAVAAAWRAQGGDIKRAITWEHIGPGPAVESVRFEDVLAAVFAIVGVDASAEWMARTRREGPNDP